MQRQSTDPRCVDCVTVGFVAVATAVVLAGVFGFGLGMVNASVAPHAEFTETYDETNGTVTIQMTGGDWLNTSRTHICGDALVNPGGEWHEYDPETGPNEEIQPGDDVTVEVTNESYTAVIQFVVHSEIWTIWSSAPNPPDSARCFEYEDPSHSGAWVGILFGFIGALALALVGTGHLLAVVASKFQSPDKRS